jgi:hypothetical protein
MNTKKHSHIFSEQLQGSEGVFRTIIPMSTPHQGNAVVTWTRYRIAHPNDTNTEATVNFFLKTRDGIVPFTAPEKATFFHWMPFYWMIPSVTLLDSEILMNINVHDTTIDHINLKLMGFDNIMGLDNQYILHGKHNIRNWSLVRDGSGFVFEQGLAVQRGGATHIYVDS